MADRQQPAITADAFTTNQIVQLWTNTLKRFPNSRRRIRYCRGVQQGREGVVRPDLATDDDPIDDPLTARHPARTNITLDAVNSFSDTKPVIERRPIGSTPTAKRGAELLALWVNTGIDATLDQDEVNAKLVEDSELAVAIVPSTAHFEHSPDFMDTIDHGKYEKLSESEKKRYREDHDDDGVTRYRTPKRQYLRDSKDRPSDHPEYSGKPHAKKTQQAYDEERQAYLASVPPWVVRIISATDCVPILVHGRGKQRFECRGLIVRTLYDREELLRNDQYIWPGQNQPELIPAGYDPNNTYGANGRIYLYEAFLTIKGEPIIAYSVGGQETKEKRRSPEGEELVDAVVKLKEEYGLNRLMVGYFYGLHTGSDNPDDRGIPYLWPLASPIVAAESLLTATNVHAWKNSFSGYFIPIDKDSPREAYLESNGALRKFSMPASGEVLAVPGAPVPAGTAEVGETARYALERYLALVETEKRDAEDDGVTSGHGLNVANELARAANRQIPEARRQIVEFVGEAILEIACAIEAKHGVAVPLQVNQEIEPGADNPGESQAQMRILELQKRWVGNVYKLDAKYPNRGNLAEVQQQADLQQRGLATRVSVLEKAGVEQPQRELAKIDAERILTGTPEGQMAMLASALRERGEAEKAATLELQLAQRLSQFGFPEADMAETPSPEQAGIPGMGGPPQGQPPAMPGVTLPNTAASSLGGIVAAGIGSGPLMNDAQAMNQASQNGAP